MFERFTEGARQVVVLAQEEARLLDHMHIGTEHLLLGAIRQADEVVLGVLNAHGVTLDSTRTAVAELIGRGDETFRGQIPFTPRAKKVLELSLVKAHDLDHKVIAPFHLVVALALEGEGVAAHILRDHGLDAANLERELAGQDPGNVGADLYAQRLAVVEAHLLASERRAELMEIAATADDARTAEAVVAERLGISPELARQVLDMRLQHFGVQHVRGLRQERDGLRAKLGR